MFATSLDILHLVLSICILALTIFLCLALYYFISSAQRFHKIIRQIETGVTKIEALVEMARDKMRNSSTYFMILGEIAKRAMEFVEKKQSQRRENKAAGKKK